MPKIENKILEAIRGALPWVFVVFAFALAVFLRAWFIEVESSDMNLFLLPWYEEFKQGGFAALYNHSGNYNVPYLILVWLATLIPLPAIAAIKLFSFLGDLLLAFGAVLVVGQLLPQGRWRRFILALSFCGTLLLPSVILNSAWWGQCDALYSAFLLIAVYFLLREKWIFAFLFVGLSLCFKLQAIFILPALIVLYGTKRRFSIFHFLVPPAMLFLSATPLIIHDQNLLAPFSIYADQAAPAYGAYVNYHNLSSIFALRMQPIFVAPLFLLTVLVCLGVLAVAMVQKLDFSGDNLLLLAAWSVMTCVVLLPRMHERYAFAGEILLLLWFAVRPSARRLAPALIFYGIGLLSCARFVLPGELWPDQNIWLGMLNVACYAWVTWHLLRKASHKSRIKSRV